MYNEIRDNFKWTIQVKGELNFEETCFNPSDKHKMTHQCWNVRETDF